MEVKKEISNFWELKDNSWGGALSTLKDIENADKEDELMQLLEEVFADREETPTETDVNDFLWFESEVIYRSLGLTENGEIPTVVDEAREDNEIWDVTVKELKESNLFEESLIDFVIDMIQTDKDEEGNPVYDEDEKYMLSFEELENNSDTVTEEQVEWLNNG